MGLRIKRGRVDRVVFPPEQVAEVKAIACELPRTHELPLSRFSQASLLSERGSAGKDPGAGLPRLDRVLVQPTPDRRRRRLGNAPLDHQAVQLNPGEARERQLVAARQLARDRLDLGDLLRGENGAGDPRAACP